MQNAYASYQDSQSMGRFSLLPALAVHVCLESHDRLLVHWAAVVARRPSQPVAQPVS